MRRVELWVDGSGTAYGSPGGWGYVVREWQCGGWLYGEGSGSEPNTTSNRMELTAALEALASLSEPCWVTLYSDSQYVVRGMTEWLPRWRRRGWRRRANGHWGPVANRDLWERLSEAAARHEVNWKHVRGHNGHELNEYADELAGRARRALLAEGECVV